MDWFSIFGTIAYWLSVIGAVISIFYYSKFTDTEKKFVHYIVLGAVFEIISIVFLTYMKSGVLEEWGIKNTLPGLHLFTLMQYIFLCIFFHDLLKRYGRSFSLILFLVIGSALIITNSVLIQSIYEYCSYSKVAVELFIIIASIAYFILVFLKKEVSSDDSVITLFVSAVFINAGMSILLHLFSNEIMALKEEITMALWSIRSAVNVITQVIIFYGIYLVLLKREAYG